jgi:ATP-dependent exoDNAse (exonuclease V) alpha subunit
MDPQSLRPRPNSGHSGSVSNEPGGVGARSLNIELQTALNPAGERKVERFGWTFAPGDKVMQIENNYDKEV